MNRYVLDEFVPIVAPFLTDGTIVIDSIAEQNKSFIIEWNPKYGLVVVAENKPNNKLLSGIVWVSLK